MDSLYVISFGMGLALLGLWISRVSSGLACSRQERHRTLPPRKSDMERAIEESVSQETESRM